MARRALQTTSAGYRFLLKRDHGIAEPRGLPHAPWINAVLKTRAEVDGSMDQVRNLGLPPVCDPPKNWDSLAALDLILRSTKRDAHIFDAGGEFFSMILPWLFLYGYKNLIAGNLVFTNRIRRGPIIYEHADITHSHYANGAFDAIVCLSVIEHGVDVTAYFREMSRIIKPGGILITSTDYFETCVDARGQRAFGCPIRIFDREGIGAAVDSAQDCGFTLLSPLDLTSGERVVHWPEFDLRYSFVIFSLRKGSHGPKSDPLFDP